MNKLIVRWRCTCCTFTSIISTQVLRKLVRTDTSRPQPFRMCPVFPINTCTVKLPTDFTVSYADTFYIIFDIELKKSNFWFNARVEILINSETSWTSNKFQQIKSYMRHWHTPNPIPKHITVCMSPKINTFVIL